MSRKVLWERNLPRNSGFVLELKQNEFVRLTAQSVIDFVAFNSGNLRERFDQARTKANQRKIFVSVGDILISKLNNTMMSIVDDTYTYGHHDLQEGMCSRKRFELVAQRGMWVTTYGNDQPVPDHGCWENLIEAVTPYGIAPEDIPSPFNIFQDMKIDGTTGSLLHSPVRPRPPGASVTLKAEMDLLVAFSVCPDPVVPGTLGATVTVMAAET